MGFERRAFDGGANGGYYGSEFRRCSGERLCLKLPKSMYKFSVFDLDLLP